ncbi:MAG: hypothetical protein LBB08_00050 [Rickettsiales bacterium]|nr:hypothetical protein [Rickettsiales bacterium]
MLSTILHDVPELKVVRTASKTGRDTVSVIQRVISFISIAISSRQIHIAGTAFLHILNVASPACPDKIITAAAANIIFMTFPFYLPDGRIARSATRMTTTKMAVGEIE